MHFLRRLGGLCCLILLAGCSLTGEAWRRGGSGERYRGDALLRVDQPHYSHAHAGLLLAYRIDSGIQADQGHLPESGWLLLRPFADRQPAGAAWIEDLEAGGAGGLRLELYKHQRGAKIRWHARLSFDSAQRRPQQLLFSVMASPTHPGGAARRLDPDRFPAFAALHYYKRRSRAALLTEAALLTPPLLVADFFCTIGEGLANSEFEFDPKVHAWMVRIRERPGVAPR